jgi:hypothetical protein
MWSHPTVDPEDRPAENAVLEAVSGVVVKHFAEVEATAGDAPPPILIQVDGPGRTQFMEKLERQLDPVVTKGSDARVTDGWTAVWFDAWQYQRLAPPWWWLMSALDQQIRRRCRRVGPWAWLRHRLHDIRWRMGRLARDLRWVLPGAVAVALGWLLWESMAPILGWLVGAAGGIAALIALLTSISNALRRHLLAESPRGTNKLLRSSDPMEELVDRYSFLIRSTGTRGIIVLIDNLDRCRADFVVEMLEGIQTLLRNPQAPKRWSLRKSPQPPPGCPLIAFVVAADRAWLCESYLHVYKEFEGTVREPGRPFGLVFLDKIFDVALRIPTVPAAAAVGALADADGQVDSHLFKDCDSEHAVRSELWRSEKEQAPRLNGNDQIPPVPAFRIQAVEALARIQIADAAPGRRCSDTARDLDKLLAELDPGLVVRRQLDTAYCVQRTTQLLGGHAVKAGDDAVCRLGLWTILDLRWPLLTNHLRRHPGDLEHLAAGTTPEGIDGDLEEVFGDPVAQRVARGFEHVTLSADDIRMFTAPLRPAGVESQDEPVPGPRRVIRSGRG